MLRHTGETAIDLQFGRPFQAKLWAVQGDSGRSLLVTILDAHRRPVDVSGLSLELYIGSADEVTKVSGVVSDAAAGVFRVQLVNTQLKYAGDVKAQFVLKNAAGEKVGSKLLDLHVEPSIENGATVGQNVLVDFAAVAEAVTLLKSYDKTLEEAKKVHTALSGALANASATTKGLSEAQKSAAELKAKLEAANQSSGALVQSLTSSEGKAKEAAADLAKKTADANTAAGNLTAGAEKATATQDALTKTYETAKRQTDALTKADGEARATEQKLREIIASADLSKYVTDPKLQATLAAYARKDVLASASEPGLMSTADKQKLDGLNPQATKTEIVDDVTTGGRDKALSAEQGRVLQANKVDKVAGKGLSTNDYDNTAKSKVDAIPSNPKYTDTTYNPATTSAAGLMSAADKAKSDRWEGVVALSNKNLNEIYTAGMYSAQNCSNAPTGGAYGAMLVMRTDATVSGTGTDTVQLYLTKDDKVYVRNCTDKSSGQWTTWREIGAGQVYSNATASASGLMSAEDKKKVDALTSASSTYEATISNRGYMSANDKTKLDYLKTNTATTSIDGYMSAADKKKLDAIPSGTPFTMTRTEGEPDIDALRTPGLYYGAFRNIPPQRSNGSGMLLVLPSAIVTTSSSVLQLYFGLGGQFLYKRTRDAGDQQWSEWASIPSFPVTP